MLALAGVAVVGALLVVAIVAGVSAVSHRGKPAADGAPTIQGQGGPRTTGATTTSTTTHAQAVAQLLSEVVVSPANGATHQRLTTVVTLKARTGRLKDVRVLAVDRPDGADGQPGPGGQRMALDGQAVARVHLYRELRRGYRRRPHGRGLGHLRHGSRARNRHRQCLPDPGHICRCGPAHRVQFLSARKHLCGSASGAVPPAHRHEPARPRRLALVQFG